MPDCFHSQRTQKCHPLDRPESGTLQAPNSSQMLSSEFHGALGWKNNSNTPLKKWAFQFPRTNYSLSTCGMQKMWTASARAGSLYKNFHSQSHKPFKTISISLSLSKFKDQILLNSPHVMHVYPSHFFFFDGVLQCGLLRTREEGNREWEPRPTSLFTQLLSSDPSNHSLNAAMQKYCRFHEYNLYQPKCEAIKLVILKARKC